MKITRFLVMLGFFFSSSSHADALKEGWDILVSSKEQMELDSSGSVFPEMEFAVDAGFSESGDLEKKGVQLSFGLEDFQVNDGLEQVRTLRREVFHKNRSDRLKYRQLELISFYYDFLTSRQLTRLIEELQIVKNDKIQALVRLSQAGIESPAKALKESESLQHLKIKKLEWESKEKRSLVYFENLLGKTTIDDEMKGDLPDPQKILEIIETLGKDDDKYRPSFAARLARQQYSLEIAKGNTFVKEVSIEVEQDTSNGGLSYSAKVAMKPWAGKVKTYKAHDMLWKVEEAFDKDQMDFDRKKIQRTDILNLVKHNIRKIRVVEESKLPLLENVKSSSNRNNSTMALLEQKEISLKQKMIALDLKRDILTNYLRYLSLVDNQTLTIGQFIKG